jgi:hypothetical protein
LLEYNYILVPPPSGFCECTSSCGRCGRIPHRIVGNFEGINPHTLKWAPTLEVRLSNLQKVIVWVKTHCIEKFLIPLKIS